MERAHLIRLKCANDGVQHATIMEQNEVLFLPVVWVHQLSAVRGNVIIKEEGGAEQSKYAHSVR